VVWRSVVAAAYIGVPLAGCIAWGGWVWLVLFAVWALVWFGFSSFWAWAIRARRSHLQPPTSE